MKNNSIIRKKSWLLRLWIMSIFFVSPGMFLQHPKEESNNFQICSLSELEAPAELASVLCVNAGKEQSKSKTVYVTRTGKKYHYKNKCGNGKYSPISFDDAQKKGFKPCEKCVLHKK